MEAATLRPGTSTIRWNRVTRADSVTCPPLENPMRPRRVDLGRHRSERQRPIGVHQQREVTPPMLIGEGLSDAASREAIQDNRRHAERSEDVLPSPHGRREARGAMDEDDGWNRRGWALGELPIAGDDHRDPATHATEELLGRHGDALEGDSSGPAIGQRLHRRGRGARGQASDDQEGREDTDRRARIKTQAGTSFSHGEALPSARPNHGAV